MVLPIGASLEMPSPLVEEKCRELQDNLATNSCGIDNAPRRPFRISGLVNNLRRPEISQRVLEELRSLPETVLDIKLKFRKIRHGLIEFEDADSDFIKNRAEDLRQRWAVIEEDFFSLLEESRSNAAEVAASISVLEALFPSENNLASFAHFRDGIGEFMEIIKDKDETTLKLGMRFTRLGENLHDFASRVQICKNRKLLDKKAQVELEIEQMRAHESSLAQEIKSLSLQVEAIGIATLRAFATSAISIVIIIMTLAPGAFIQVVISTLESLSLGIELSKKKEELSQLREEKEVVGNHIQLLLEEKDALERFHGMLQQTHTDVSILAQKMEVIARLWQAIRTDLIELKSKLDYLLKKNTDAHSYVDADTWDLVRSTHELYLICRGMLEEYAKNIPSKSAPLACPCDNEHIAEPDIAESNEENIPEAGDQLLPIKETMDKLSGLPTLSHKGSRPRLIMRMARRLTGKGLRIPRV